MPRIISGTEAPRGIASDQGDCIDDTKQWKTAPSTCRMSNLIRHPPVML